MRTISSRPLVTLPLQRLHYHTAHTRLNVLRFLFVEALRSPLARLSRHSGQADAPDTSHTPQQAAAQLDAHGTQPHAMRVCRSTSPRLEKPGVTTTSALQQATCPFSVTHHLQEILQSHTTHLPSGSLVTFSFSFLESSGHTAGAFRAGTAGSSKMLQITARICTLTPSQLRALLVSVGAAGFSLATTHSSYARCAQAQQGYIALVTAHRWLCPSARHHLAFNRSHIPHSYISYLVFTPSELLVLCLLATLPPTHTF